MLKLLFKVLKYTFSLLIILLSVALIVRVILFKGPFQAPQSLSKSKIIDMHVHIAGLGYGQSGCFISEEMKKGYKFDYYLNAFGITREELAANGDQLLVQRMVETIAASKEVQGVVVLAMDGVINDKGELDKEKTQVYIPNDYVAGQVALYPSLYFGASINPYRKDALRRLERVKQQGAKLIKWIPNIQHIDPADNKLIPFYKKMKALEIPLLTHTGQERSFHSAIDEYADPKKLELPLSLGVTVIAAHIATTGDSENESNFQRILPLFDKYPNLYSDISSLTQINKLGFLEKAVKDSRLQGRLLYGSDFPLVNMILVSPYYFPLNLTIKQMRTISKMSNPWDRDIALKQLLGVPKDIFEKSAKILNIQLEVDIDD
jgi:predicted TIM-barrel fold metal-dependent hydrolase